MRMPILLSWPNRLWCPPMRLDPMEGWPRAFPPKWICQREWICQKFRLTFHCQSKPLDLRCPAFPKCFWPRKVLSLASRTTSVHRSIPTSHRPAPIRPAPIRSMPPRRSPGPLAKSQPIKSQPIRSLSLLNSMHRGLLRPNHDPTRFRRCCLPAACHRRLHHLASLYPR